MTTLRVFTQLMIVFSALLFLMTILDFLALHDISHEYVSASTLNNLDIRLSAELPEYTKTPDEWTALRISTLARFIFLILNTAVLLLCLRRLHRPVYHAPSS